MPQVTEFPAVGSDARGTLLAIARVSRELPEAGIPFRELRARLRAAKLWDKERPAVPLRILGLNGPTVMPSAFTRAVAATKVDDDALAVISDRLRDINPLLFKTVFELLEQRAHHKDEIYKYLSSFAYRGKVPSRPDLEHYFLALLATGVARTLGIALILGPIADRHRAAVAALDVDVLLETDTPYPEPVIPASSDDDPAVAAASAAHEAEVATAAETAATAALPAQSSSPLPTYLRHLVVAGTPSPRNRERPVPISRFAAGFSDEVLAETTKRIGDWQRDAGAIKPVYEPADFGFEPEAWVEGSDEVLYRVAVAAALVFRLDTEREGVLRAYRALEQAGVLADLYHGTVPESLPAQVDARALMLASLAARRCAESPELASSLEQQKSAGDAFTALEAALGRGLFRIELFWILGMLGRLGVLRWDDLGEVSALPHRLVRDQLFRLGFLATPYASEPVALVAAARAARKAAGADPADEIVARFAIAAGCAYDCPNRKACDFPCRERLE